MTKISDWKKIPVSEMFNTKNKKTSMKYIAIVILIIISIVGFIIISVTYNSFNKSYHTDDTISSQTIDTKLLNAQDQRYNETSSTLFELTNTLNLGTTKFPSFYALLLIPFIFVFVNVFRRRHRIYVIMIVPLFLSIFFGFNIWFLFIPILYIMYSMITEVIL